MMDLLDTIVGPAWLIDSAHFAVRYPDQELLSSEFLHKPRVETG